MPKTIAAKKAQKKYVASRKRLSLLFTNEEYETVRNGKSPAHNHHWRDSQRAEIEWGIMRICMLSTRFNSFRNG